MSLGRYLHVHLNANLFQLKVYERLHSEIHIIYIAFDLAVRELHLSAGKYIIYFYDVKLEQISKFDAPISNLY